jgi:hypothetical protein
MIRALGPKVALVLTLAMLLGLMLVTGVCVAEPGLGRKIFPPERGHSERVIPHQPRASLQ